MCLILWARQRGLPPCMWQTACKNKPSQERVEGVAEHIFSTRNVKQIQYILYLEDPGSPGAKISASVQFASVLHPVYWGVMEG